MALMYSFGTVQAVTTNIDKACTSEASRLLLLARELRDQVYTYLTVNVDISPSQRFDNGNLILEPLAALDDTMVPTVL